MSGRKKEVRVVVEYKKDWLYEKKHMKLADSVPYRIALVDNSGTQWLERPLQIVSKLNNRNDRWVVSYCLGKNPWPTT